MMQPLSITGLTIDYGRGPAVAGVDLTIAPGEIVGVIGESGSGKSSIAMAAMGLLPSTAAVTADRFEVGGLDVRNIDEQAWTGLRGTAAAMIFQEPMTALNPSSTVGAQIEEALTIHGIESAKSARGRALELLNQVHMPQPEVRMRQFPFQLSGGQRQRVMIAMAMAAAPRLLVADEPTTALDVTVQAQILDLIVEIRDRTDMGVLFISHDLAVVSQLCSRVLVMYCGRVVETGQTGQVLSRPRHPYTVALLESVLAGRQEPRTVLKTVSGDFLDGGALTDGALNGDRDDAEQSAGPVPISPEPPIVVTEPAIAEPAFVAREGDDILRFDDVRKVYSAKGGQHITALDGVSLTVRRGETFGVVGESGSGKSTLSRLGTLIERPTSGTITFDGVDITAHRGRRLREFRSKIQVVFQDPNDSLDPRFTVAQSVGEPLRSAKLPRDDAHQRVVAALVSVGLDESAMHRRPHEFSGGQRQRIAIARAMVTDPEFVVLDEATSALDVSVQAQILNLLLDLQNKTGVTYLFISHNLAVVRHLAQRMAVMKSGRLVEIGSSTEIFDNPQDDYTQQLLASIPTLEFT